MQMQFNKVCGCAGEKHWKWSWPIISPFHQDASLPRLPWFQVLNSKTKDKERRNSKLSQFSPTLLPQSFPSNSSWRNPSKANLLVSLSIHGVMPLDAPSWKNLIHCHLECGQDLSSQPLRIHLSYRAVSPHASASIHSPRSHPSPGGLPSVLSEVER